ncbi:MAG: GyrI-like domain-containing protein [Acidipropionibacterium sp.]|jgi:hypothetical protein|nr:GyrI-like domain-containing protein [Acidipropionibacterium sp.]
MTHKTDFKKTLDGYRAKHGQFRVLEVPTMGYLMIEGHGDPNTDPSYSAALEALYSVAYKLKFASKNELGQDYTVPPLEGLWWAEDHSAFMGKLDKSSWYWEAMLMVPEWIDRTMFEATVEKTRQKNPPARLEDIRLDTLSEGRCVQTLHLGSFDDEGPILQRMHDQFIPGNGLRPTGRHHEIYLSDFRRTAPEKLKTILRQPVIAA